MVMGIFITKTGGWMCLFNYHRVTDTKVKLLITIENLKPTDTTSAPALPKTPVYF
jgi:hypothetical protein